MCITVPSPLPYVLVLLGIPISTLKLLSESIINTLANKQKKTDDLEDEFGKSIRNRTKRQIGGKKERKLESPFKRCNI